MNRRNLISSTACAGLGVLLTTRSSWASAPYPDRPIKLIVPWTPGASTDILARTVGQNVGDLLGKSVIVDNRPGASGRLGIEAMARSAPDGYTLGLIELAHAIAPSVFQKMSYDLLGETTPVSLLGNSPLVLFADAQKYKAGDFQKFVDDARRAPAPYTIATSGNGSISHIAAGLFAKALNLQVNLIPYKGSSPALTDVAGQTVSAHFCTLASASSLLSAKKIVPLMVTGAQRIAQLPDTPSASDLRLPNLDFVQWWALVAPARTPKEVLAVLQKAVASTLGNPQVESKVSSLAIKFKGAGSEDTSAFIRTEVTHWGKVVQELGIRPE